MQIFTRLRWRNAIVESDWPADIRFYRKQAVGPDQSRYNQSPLWSRLHTTLAQITRINPKWTYTEYKELKIFSSFRMFQQFAVALKNRVALEFFTLLNIFFAIQDFWATLRLSWKQSCPEIFHCIEYTFTFRIFEQLALALKIELPWK